MPLRVLKIRTPDGSESERDTDNRVEATVDESTLKSFFDAFYEHLVLRDFYGKIIPGLVLLFTVFSCLANADSFTLVGSFSQLSVLGWLVLLGVAWVTAFAIQAFGEWFPPNCVKRFISVRQLIHYYPPEFEKDEDWYTFRAKFEESASRDDRTQVERLVVIKEACGNGYVSLGISLMFAATFLLLRSVSGTSSLEIPAIGGMHRWLPLLLLIIFLIVFLRKMHKIHVERQYKYMKGVVTRSTGKNVSSHQP